MNEGMDRAGPAFGGGAEIALNNADRNMHLPLDIKQNNVRFSGIGQESVLLVTDLLPGRSPPKPKYSVAGVLLSFKFAKFSKTPAN